MKLVEFRRVFPPLSYGTLATARNLCNFVRLIYSSFLLDVAHRLPTRKSRNDDRTLSGSLFHFFVNYRESVERCVEKHGAGDTIGGGSVILISSLDTKRRDTAVAVCDSLIFPGFALVFLFASLVATYQLERLWWRLACLRTKRAENNRRDEFACELMRIMPCKNIG